MIVYFLSEVLCACGLSSLSVGRSHVTYSKIIDSLECILQVHY